MAQNELTDRNRALASRFSALIQKTNIAEPAEEDIRALRQFLSEAPQLWILAGNLAEQAAFEIIESTRGPSLLKESLRVGYVEIQKDLGLEGSTPLEGLLVQQVVLAWLRLNIVEQEYTRAKGASALMRGPDYWERRLNASQRRFLRACEVLARIRKMNLPSVQVNIAKQQVNVAG